MPPPPKSAVSALHERAHLQWERIRRHPDYRQAGKNCLRQLPETIRKRFASLREEYPPAETARWQSAKAYDAQPFGFPYSPRRFSEWQRRLWKFYQRWGLCYPLPHTITHPHPVLLAWLTPRPAETISPTAQTLLIRLDPRAPFAQTLSCLSEEIRAARTAYSSPACGPLKAHYHPKRETGPAKRVRVVSRGPRTVVATIPLRTTLPQAHDQVKAILQETRQRYALQPELTRRNVAREQRAFTAYDLCREGNAIFVVASQLQYSARQALYGIQQAYYAIRKQPYPGKKAMQAAHHPDEIEWDANIAHLNHCAFCRTGHGLRTPACREFHKSLDRLTGMRTAH